MSKAITFFISILTTLALCVGVGCTIKESKAALPWINPQLPQPVVAEYLPPPGHVLVENNKILRYQLRHNYTLNCEGKSYAAIRYSTHDDTTHIQLLEGTNIQLKQVCLVRKADPLHTVYIYERVPKP